MNECFKTRFDGKVTLVTGAGSDIGLATAEAFAEAGASVVLADVQEEAVRTIAERLVACGRKALAVRCDVTDDGQVASMVERAVSSFGRLDAAFNNAGVMQHRIDTADISGDEWDRVMAINLRGVWSCMKEELRQMLRQGSGAIVNCSSLGGVVGNPGLAADHASKHGVIGLTKTAALEYAARGIRINAVCLGSINTPMAQALTGGDPNVLAELVRDEPIGRLVEPEEIAGAVLWFCSPAASYVVGHVLLVDGGALTRKGSVGVVLLMSITPTVWKRASFGCWPRGYGWSPSGHPQALSSDDLREIEHVASQFTIQET